MKKLVLACILLGLLLAGCDSSETDTEQLFRSDTVVNIPLNPEEPETQEPTAEQTLPPAESVTEGVTESTAEETAAPSSVSSSSGKSSSSKSSGSSKASASSSKATETTQAATEVPTIEPPETEPPETEPPETQSPEAAIYEISDYVAGGLEYAVAEQINAYRTEAGLEPLGMNGYLCGIASVRAYEVCVSWSHTRPDGRGWQSVLSDYGFGYGSAAEELAHTGGFDAAAIVSKWMSSESNSADILSADFTTIGVGVYNTGGATFIAAIFVG